MRAINLSFNMERACISRSLSWQAPEGNPFPARSFLPFCLPHEYLVREQPRGPLSRFPHDLLPPSAGYFSLSQPGLRILATCHCPLNDYAVSDSPPWNNISLGHPIIAEMRSTLRDYFHYLLIFVINDAHTYHDHEFYSAALAFLSQFFFSLSHSLSVSLFIYDSRNITRL